MNFKTFIVENEAADTAKLMLARERYPEVDMALAVSTIESRRKLRDKVPEWYACTGLIYPSSLSAEQCSSTATARYKAVLAGYCKREDSTRACNALSSGPSHHILRPCCRKNLSAAGPSPSTGRGWPASLIAIPCQDARIADLTGGMGVDSWAFAEVFGEVLYNEAEPVLAEAARRNFDTLGVKNITVKCCRVGEVPVREILGGFEPDVIFLDPARRSSTGRKVFLLEDCSPDVSTLVPELLEAAPYVLLKLSPMADISMLLERLPHVKQVHILAVKGECKELLLLLERGFEGESEMVAVEMPDQVGHDGREFRFRRSEEAGAMATFGTPVPGDLLFEPGKALLKAGCFNLISERFGLSKLGRNSHIYFYSDPASASQLLQNVGGLGKVFRVVEVLPLDKRSVAEAGAKFPGADVTARGVPMSSEELSERLRKAARKGAQEGREGVSAHMEEAVHLYAVHCDEAGRNLLLVTTRNL